MAASQSTIGYGTIFSVNGVPVLECKTVKTNQVTVPVVDATHLLSPNATEEKKPGIIKPGTVEISGNFVGDDTQLQFLTFAQARTLFDFAVVAPINEGAQTYTCAGAGFVSKYDTGPFEVSKLIEFMMTMEITGPVTETIT